MPQRSLLWPLSIITIFSLFILAPFIFNESTAAPLSAGCSGNPGEAAYEACKKQCFEITAQPTEYPLCKQLEQTIDATNTAIVALTSGTVFPTNTNTPTNTNPPAAPPPSQNSPTRTATATATRTATLVTVTTPTRGPGSATPASITPTSLSNPPTATPAIQGAICAPGEQFELSGQAPPNTSLVVTFDPLSGEGTATPVSSRVVSGGLSDSTGQYRIVLLIGDERPGIYNLRVRVRSSFEVLKTEVCTVPMLTPTATPRVVR